MSKWVLNITPHVRQAARFVGVVGRWGQSWGRVGAPEPSNATVLPLFCHLTHGGQGGSFPNYLSGKTVPSLATIKKVKIYDENQELIESVVRLSAGKKEIVKMLADALYYEA